MWITKKKKKKKNMGNSSTHGNTGHLTCLLRNLYAVQEATFRTGHVTVNLFKTGKGVHQGCILSSAYLTSMQSTLWEMPHWMNHKLQSRLAREISITSDIRWQQLNVKKQRGTEEVLDKGERVKWKKLA